MLARPDGLGGVERNGRARMISQRNGRSNGAARSLSRCRSLEPQRLCGVRKDCNCPRRTRVPDRRWRTAADRWWDARSDSSRRRGHGRRIAGGCVGPADCREAERRDPAGRHHRRYDLRCRNAGRHPVRGDDRQDLRRDAGRTDGRAGRRGPPPPWPMRQHLPCSAASAQAEPAQNLVQGAHDAVAEAGFGFWLDRQPRTQRPNG